MKLFHWDYWSWTRDPLDHTPQQLEFFLLSLLFPPSLRFAHYPKKSKISLRRHSIAFYIPEWVPDDMKLIKSKVIDWMKKVDESCYDICDGSNPIAGCDVIDRVSADWPVDCYHLQRNHFNELEQIMWAFYCQLTLYSPCRKCSSATNVLTRAVRSPFHPWIVKRVGWLGSKFEFCKLFRFLVMIWPAVGFRRVRRMKTVSVSATNSGSTGVS